MVMESSNFTIFDIIRLSILQIKFQILIYLLMSEQTNFLRTLQDEKYKFQKINKYERPGGSIP